MYSYYIEYVKGERKVVYVYLETLKMFVSFLQRHVTPKGVYSTHASYVAFEKLHRETMMSVGSDQNIG
jgi:hypothetical protein